MGIEALEKYFLYDVRSNGDIPFIEELNREDGRGQPNH
jgi:hypothetical protein